jgi:hypothetical protein
MLHSSVGKKKSKSQEDKSVGLSAAYSFTVTDRGYVGLQNYERKMITKIDRFTADGTFTVPSGVTYAIAHIRAGGGGLGGSAGAGGTSSVAFAGGTISATGGAANTTNSNNASFATAGAANSGQGASGVIDSGFVYFANYFGGNGAYIVAGDAVTPAASITVTVGAGGVAGTNGKAGGSGYVWIEYQVTA